jgi:hypothetical protein
MLDTFDSVVAEANALGLEVNNLFQIDGGLWQANMRDDYAGHEFVKHKDPIQALKLCLEKARKFAKKEAENTPPLSPTTEEDYSDLV